jgi:hypothetical protein
MLSIYWRCRVPAPGRVGVTVMTPDNTPLVELEPVELTKAGGQTMQGSYTLSPFRFPVEGVYPIVLQYNGTEIMRTELILRKRPKVS